MMKEEIVLAFFSAIESKHWEKLSDLTTSDFLFWGPMPSPLDKATYIELQKAIQHAIPDWSYHLSNMSHRENCIIVTVHISGTHTEEFTLPIPGVEPVPPTNIKFELPIEGVILTFKEDKIFDLRVEDVYYKGLKVLFEKLGLKPGISKEDIT